MWAVLAIASGVFYTLVALLNRKIFVTGRDPWIFSFFFSATIAVVSFPIVLFTYEAPPLNDYYLWGLIVAASAFVLFHNYLNFTALKFLSASVHGTFYKIRLIWAFLIGLVLGVESWHALTAVGIVLTITAGALLLWKRDGSISTKGVVLVLGSSFVNAFTLILFKYLYEGFGVNTLILVTSFLPCLMIVAITPRFFPRAKEFMSKGMTLVLAATLAAVGANYAILYAIQLGNVSAVLVMVEAFLILVLAGEHFFLKERESVYRKLAAVLLATLGAAAILLV